MLYESSKVDKLQEALSKRVVSCLKNIVNLKKFSNFADVEEAYLASTLEALLERHNICEYQYVIAIMYNNFKGSFPP